MTNKELRMAKKAARAQAKSEQEAKPPKADLRGEKKRKRPATQAGDADESEREDAGEEDDKPSSVGAEEAVSHKEARKRRKLAKAAAMRAEQGLPEPEAKVEHTKEKETRSQFALWVGNMSFQTASEKLVDWLADKGINGISRVAMPKGVRKGEKNRGYAYVDVPSQNEVEIGIRMSELMLDGRKLLIKSANDFAGRPGIPAAAVQAGESALSEAQKARPGLPRTAAAILRKQRHPPAETLFLGNLSFKTTVDDIEMMLTRAADERMNRSQKQAAAAGRSKDSASTSDSDADSDSNSDVDVDEGMSADEDGKPRKPSTKNKPAKDAKAQGGIRGAGIRKIRMGTFEDAPEKCKGWAFVDFHTLEHATASLIDAPATHRLLGRQLEVAYASPDAVRRGAKKAVRRADTEKPKPVRLGKNARLQKREQEQQEQEGRPVMRQWGVAAATTEASGASVSEAAPAPVPTPAAPFDPDAPLAKAHKPTQAERAAARAARPKKGPSSSRPAPGAALAHAQRGPTAAAPAGTKTTFD